jgi:hypothetical protein
MRRLCLPVVAGLVLAFGLASASAHTLSKTEARHETRLLARDRCETMNGCKRYEVTVCSKSRRHSAKCEFTLFSTIPRNPSVRFRCRYLMQWWLKAGSDEVRGPEAA